MAARHKKAVQPRTSVLTTTPDFERALNDQELHMQAFRQHIEKECASEMEQLEKAQQSLDAKLRHVLHSRAAQQMEEDVAETGARVRAEMRKVHRHLQAEHERIVNDKSLSDAERRDAMRGLTRSVQTEFERLVHLYPAAIQSHMASSARLAIL